MQYRIRKLAIFNSLECQSGTVGMTAAGNTELSGRKSLCG